MIRFCVSVLVLIGLVALMMFSEHRWAMVASCHERGGVWDGTDDRCRLLPHDIHLYRGLTRT
ncbi:MAG: hypothetical protein AAFR55_04240 [Pseudomonadota bacterium]